MKEAGPRLATDQRMSTSSAAAPTGFVFPRSFKTMAARVDLPDISPMFWMFELESDGIPDWTEILAEQFPERSLVPFAKDGGSDDVYCFDGSDLSGDPVVLLIHSFTDPGWEYRGEWFNFDSWFAGAVEFHESWLKGEVEDFETGRPDEGKP